MLLACGVLFVLLMLFVPAFVIEGALLTLVLTGAALDAAAFAAAGLTLAIWVAARYVAMTRVPRGAARDDGFQPLADQVADSLGAPRRPVYRVPGRQANAWALPAAVVITAGLAEQDVRVVRGVLAHEFAHVTLRHPQLYGLAAVVFGASHGLAGHLEAAAEADFKRRRSGSPAVAGGLFGFGAGFHRGVAAIGAWLAGPWLKNAEFEADLLAAGRFGGDLELALCQVAGPGFGPTGLWEGFVPFHPSVQERLDAIRAVMARARQKEEKVQEEKVEQEPSGPPAAEAEIGPQEREPEVQFDPAFLCPVAADAAAKTKGVAAAKAAFEEGRVVVLIAVAQDWADRAFGVGRAAKRAAEAALLKATGREIPVAVRVAQKKEEKAQAEASAAVESGTEPQHEVQFDPGFLCPVAAAAAAKAKGVAAAKAAFEEGRVVVLIAVAQDWADRAFGVGRAAKRAAEAALLKATGREIPVAVRVASVASSAAGGMAKANGGAA